VVSVRPRFAANHSRVTYAWAGALRNVTCRSMGVPTPKIDWIVRNIELQNNATYHIHNLGATSHLQVSGPIILTLFPYSFLTLCRNQKLISEEGVFSPVSLDFLFFSSLPSLFSLFSPPRNGSSNAAKGFGEALLASLPAGNDIYNYQTCSVAIKRIFGVFRAQRTCLGLHMSFSPLRASSAPPNT